MEVYPLDPLYRRAAVIDSFESLIWAERFREIGDFTLNVNPTLANKNALRIGTNLAMNLSNRVMTVETIEEKHNADGRRLLEIRGRSLEKVMLDRVAKNSTDDLTTSPKWTITDTPAEIARKIFRDICITGILDSNDVIPFINEGTFMPADTIPESLDDITVNLDPQLVHTAVSDLCEIWNMGYRLLRNGDLSELWFDIYMGSDRTSKQTILPAVVFSPELDNLQDTSELSSIAEAKNVAYVYSPAGFMKVYAPNVDPEVEGFQRRILVVVATDITVSNPDVEQALIQRGEEELSKHRAISAFDGVINPNSEYKYGRDYNLGDVVEQRSDTGETQDMRVTEQIFTSDSEGEKSYPTLVKNEYITTGSWLSYPGTRVWTDFGLTEYWDTQP